MKTEETKIEAKQEPISFQTSIPASQQNSTRETEAHRSARIGLLISGASFLGVLGLANSQKLKAGQTLRLQDGTEISLKNPQGLRCSACGGVNGLRDSNEALLAMNSAWVKDAHVFFLSDSCRQKYAEPVVSKLVKGADLYRSIFPKAKAR